MSKPNHKLATYLLEQMYEQSKFSDLCLEFIHPAYPFSMRFHVHKSIVSQSPFFNKLLQKDPESKQLVIHLATAFTACGFVLAPFQHITRRKWQKTTSNNDKTVDRSPLLSSHLRFVVKWLYTCDKSQLIKDMPDDDTLRILSVAVLLDIHDLSQACVDRYTTHQLTFESIMRDLETICQLPRQHPAYLKLRDATLLLLFRFGPDHAAQLSQLPVDYMADALSADILFVKCEFERYTLLRSVLMSYMQSVGKITWTSRGPVDRDSKRLSGFVKPLQRPDLSATLVRSRKRKRIPSQDLLPEDTSASTELNRLSFTSLVPFEKLAADTNSGGVIDKATVISYLLRTTVNYSNMTFDQLTAVRQDGIVDEHIVFRALWQREALERVLYPLTYHRQTQQQQENIAAVDDAIEERSQALNEYFDVDNSEQQQDRRRLLLGTPKFRFNASIYIHAPTIANGWKVQQLETVFDDEERDDSSIWSGSDNGVDQLQVGSSATVTTKSYDILQKCFYSEPELVLGNHYRVKVDAQVMPRHRLMIQDTDTVEDPFCVDTDMDQSVLVCRFELQRDRTAMIPPPKPVKEEKKKDTTPVLTSHIPRPVEIPVNAPPRKEPVVSKNMDKVNMHYWIYCLNQHEGILETNKIDPEDRVLVAVTEQREREETDDLTSAAPGYVGQVLIESKDLSQGLVVDATVALELFGFNKV